jgi:hypothetical protein
MNEQLIKEYISNLIKSEDKSKENILRQILFSSPIDWVQVKEIIEEQRPETTGIFDID